MIVLGLTGSIAMGKSTIGEMIRRLGIPVHESDKSAHDLLKHDSPARPALAKAFPYYTYPELYERKTYDFNRKKLGDLVFKDNQKRLILESILHPYIHDAQQEFIQTHRRKAAQIICLDIPLLFETNAQNRVDYTIVVSAPQFLQRARALSRPSMSAEKLDTILAQQMPDSEKCAHADYVIKTGLSRAHSIKEFQKILQDIRIRENIISNPDEENALHETAS